MTIEFWFDFASTYSYPTALRIEKLAARKGVKVVWRPFLLGPIFNKQGWNDSPFNIYPVKGKYMWRDMERECENINIPFVQPTIFPQNGLVAARIATRFAGEPWQSVFIQAVFSANFESNQDISSLDVITSCLKCSEGDAAEIIREANSQESKDMLKKKTDIAHQKGIFGAPTFFVGDEMFWGNDRLEKAIQWALGEKAQ